MEFDASLDCAGLYCPLPIVYTAERIVELEPGQVLEVVSTDEGVESDMKAWCKSTGHEYLGMEESDGEYRVYVRKVGS